MARARVHGMVLAGVVAVAALAGCTDDDAGGDQGGAAPDATATEPEGATPSADGESSTPGSTEGATGGDLLVVEAEGEGPIGLLATEVPDGGAQDYSGMLISGPGGCLAMEADAPPQLLVFADDAEFVLRDARPSVTTPGLGTVQVGEDVELAAVPVPLEVVDGIPAACAEGSQDEVLVVEG
ncbi:MULTISPECIES: hypothetical protein [Isoptericola]|uniref:hypothetical protein n=1 Tax=Isoptericola TaxID=254250 RepID=UPI00383A666A